MGVLKKIGIVLGCLVAAALVVLITYVVYMEVNFYRIDDNQTLSIENNQKSSVDVGAEYKALTFNVGFCAYSSYFDFFMDSGTKKNGKVVSGTHGTAISEDDVLKNLTNAINIVSEEGPDFALIQEVDTNSTRSYGVNECYFFKKAFSDYASTFANNFHSSFLAWPLTDMHGSVESGILTLSKYRISSSLRRSYPIDMSFLGKFIDLDRCFSVTRVPVSNGKELVLVNSHMSAYDADGSSKQQQMEMLSKFMASESALGNYVIVGGDWNQSFCNASIYTSDYEAADWAVNVLTDADFPAGYHIVKPDNMASVPTCRNANEPYVEGSTGVYSIDGFVVSDNISAKAKTIDRDFSYSDHNPVTLTFTLL